MNKPLALRVRPTNQKNFHGQQHLIGVNGVITQMLNNNSISSMILFGPTGSGKTTIAHLILNQYESPNKFVNATNLNKTMLVEIFATAKMHKNFLLIVDEFHRLSKDRQDLFLPEIENGTIILCALTTENPVFAINNAILSRTHVFQLFPISQNDLILRMKEIILDEKLEISLDKIEEIAQISNGDLRSAINMIELTSLTPEVIHTKSMHSESIYDYLSALQKSIRGSDVDASLFWLGKLLILGDIKALERRLLVIAYEDIGLANSSLNARVVSAIQAAAIVGLPEAKIIYAEITCELALSAKSRSSYLAFKNVENIHKTQNFTVPTWLKLNTLNNENLYDYNNQESWKYYNYLPDEISFKNFFTPSKNGEERQLALNHEKLLKIKKK